MPTIQELCDKLATAFEQMKNLVDEAEARSDNPGVFSGEEQEKYDRISADIDQYDQRIERQEQLASRKALGDQPLDRRSDPGQPGGDNPGEDADTRGSGADPEIRWDDCRYDTESQLRGWAGNPDQIRRAKPAYRDAFGGYMRDGQQALYGLSEQRALQADADISGGYLVAPTQFVGGLIMAKDDLCFLRKLATVHLVPNADSLGAVSLDNDPADPAWTAEIGDVSEDSTMSFGKRELHPHQLTKLVKVSMKLLRKTSGGAEALVRNRLAYKFGVTEEANFLTGSGANEPLGLFTLSDNGIPAARDVATDMGATAVTADGLMNVAYTLKGQYWPNARWLWHRDGIKQIRKLKDDNNQYIWQPGLAGGQPNTLLNFPYVVSEYCPNTFTASQYVGMLGDFSYYWIADALNFSLQRLMELYAGNNQVGFIGRAETDGMPVLGEAFVRVKLAAS